MRKVHDIVHLFVRISPASCRSERPLMLLLLIARRIHLSEAVQHGHVGVQQRVQTCFNVIAAQARLRFVRLFLHIVPSIVRPTVLGRS